MAGTFAVTVTMTTVGMVPPIAARKSFTLAIAPATLSCRSFPWGQGFGKVPSGRAVLHVLGSFGRCQGHDQEWRRTRRRLLFSRKEHPRGRQSWRFVKGSWIRLRPQGGLPLVLNCT